MSFREAIQDRVANKILSSSRSSVIWGAVRNLAHTLSLLSRVIEFFCTALQLTERLEEVNKTKLVRPMKLE